jgi:2,3,4,5-tetrahydropyridine-2-carboxylate N-succinyltransferase
MDSRQQVIEEAWEARASLSPAAAPTAVKDAVASVIDDLDGGRLRVAEKANRDWTTHQWLKKAVLISFRLTDNSLYACGDAPGDSPRYFD